MRSWVRARNPWCDQYGDIPPLALLSVFSLPKFPPSFYLPQTLFSFALLFFMYISVYKQSKSSLYILQSAMNGTTAPCHVYMQPAAFYTSPYIPDFDFSWYRSVPSPLLRPLTPWRGCNLHHRTAVFPFYALVISFKLGSLPLPSAPLLYTLCMYVQYCTYVHLSMF